MIDADIRLTLTTGEELDRDSPGITVHREHAPGGFIRQWFTYSPATAVTIERIEPGVFDVTAFDTLHSVSGVQAQGGFRQDEGDYRSFRLTHHPAVPFTKESGERSTWWETPWVAFTASGGDGVVAMLAYGGQWSFHVDESGTARWSVDGIRPDIEPGETWTSPEVWIAPFSGDVDEASATTYRLLREAVIPTTPDDFPWVQYNTWFSWFCDLDEQTLLREAEVAADMGVEVFYVDAGWWVGNPRRRDRFSSALGTWRENTEKFPHGLAWFADRIRDLGMHFGIWVEPERVDLRTSHTGTWDEAWIAESGGTYIRCPWPSDTNTAWLCFGHSGTQAWALEWITDLVESLGVRWLKWDSNYWDVCTNAFHGHGAGDGERAQLEGVYAVMAGLRERFPDLIIENCAGGATRMDYMLAQQTHAAWLNDASEPHHRSRFHNAGATTIFPPEYLNAWITESEHENVNGQDLPDEVWRAIIRSRMLGAIGFSNKLHTWSDRTKEIAKEEIALYRDSIRPILKRSNVYHLLPQPAFPSKDIATPNTWEAYQIATIERDRSVILAFRNVATAPSLRIQPRGLDSALTYRVVVGDVATDRTGADLLENGLTLACKLLASVIVRIESTG
jgi:alpha-galactosidase